MACRIPKIYSLTRSVRFLQIYWGEGGGGDGDDKGVRPAGPADIAGCGAAGSALGPAVLRQL